MADHLRYPPNAQIDEATEQPLSKGPQDMPSWNGSQGKEQITSTRVPLSRTEHPVAQFGAHPGHGQTQCTSSEAPLRRNATSPYDSINKTKPQVPFQGSKK